MDQRVLTVDGKAVMVDGYALSADNIVDKFITDHVEDTSNPHQVTAEQIGAAASEHNHDDIYYTESEIDTKLAAKAESSHTHAAGDITSGTLPIAQGGTGATTAAAALTNLGAVSKSGDTMTGTLVQKNVTLNDGVNNVAAMVAYDDGDSNNYGAELVIGANGNTFIGSGESPKSLRTLLVGDGDTVTNESYTRTGEATYISSDGLIYLETGCNTVANRKCVKIDTSGMITAPGGFSGNAAAAIKLTNARTIQTNLASTSSASFNGTANVTPGVTGTLPISNGGTGGTTAANAVNNLVNALSTVTPVVSDIIPFKDASGTAGKMTISTLANLLQTSGGYARIQSGSYVGTGTYGEDNPCSLTFDFVPELFIIMNSSLYHQTTLAYSSSAGTNVGITYPKLLSSEYLTNYAIGCHQSKSEEYIKIVSKTIYWYSTYSGGIAQFNAEGTTYHYLYIG